MGTYVPPPPGTGSGSQPPVEDVPFPRTVFAPVVEWKRAWDDEWQPMPEAELLSVELGSAHGGALSCTFRRRYGEVKLPFEADFPAATEPLIGQFLWIRASVFYEGPEDIEQSIVFVGVILDDHRQIHMSGGYDPDSVASGAQRFTAHGADRILERVSVAESVWLVGEELEEEVRRMEWVPSVNYRDPSRSIIGNRSADRSPDTDVYLFGGEAVWTHMQFAEYVLAEFVQQASDGTAPRWRVAGETAALDRLEHDVALGSSETAGQILRRLINPSLGLDFVITPFRDDPAQDNEDGFEIFVFALAQEEVSFGGQTLPANPAQLQVENPSDPELGNVEIVQSFSRAYDEIRVRGRRTVVCCSLDREADPEAITKRWTDSLEADYKAGTGTPADNGDLHDLARRATRFRTVFQEFGPSSSWAFNGGQANPQFDDAGELLPPDSTKGQMVVRQTLPWLPLQFGYDYFQTPPVSLNPEGQDADLLRPLAWVYDNASDRYWYAEDVDARVSPLTNGLGVRVDISPNHALARGHLGPSAFKTEHQHPYFDWQDVVATVAFESDFRMSLAFEIPAEQRIGDGSRIDIDVPDAEVWYVAPNTAIALDPSTGELVRTTEPILVRNDFDRLALVMAGAISRYYLGRGRAIVRSMTLAPWAFTVGQILTVVDEGSHSAHVHGAITKVTWSLHEDKRFTTTVHAGFVR